MHNANTEGYFQSLIGLANSNHVNGEQIPAQPQAM